MPNNKWEKNICKIKNTTPNSKKKKKKEIKNDKATWVANYVFLNTGSICHSSVFCIYPFQEINVKGP